MSMRLGRIEGVGIRGWGYVFAIAIGFGPLTAPEARAQAPSAPDAVTLDGLLRMSPAELDMVYRQGTARAIPEGRIRGTALLQPGTRRTRALSRVRGCSGRGRCSSPARPLPSTASSGCG